VSAVADGQLRRVAHRPRRSQQDRIGWNAVASAMAVGSLQELAPGRDVGGVFGLAGMPMAIESAAGSPRQIPPPAATSAA
jgi:hypothetical protein